MRKHALALVLFLLLAASAFAQGNDGVVHWKSIIGVITAPGNFQPGRGYSERWITVDNH
jgi:hypothetical protein